MTTMIAYRFVPGSPNVVKQEVPVPKPAADEVLLKVAAAGLCHSDLHILSSEVKISEQPWTMGHETTGTFLEAGSEVPAGEFKSGALYAVIGRNPCGESTCPQCKDGKGTICAAPRYPVGIGRDGGFAEFVTVPHWNLVPVPSGVTAAQATAATDAILTPYHGIKTNANLKEGENVVVIGLGGVGGNAFLIAKLLAGKAGKVFATDIKAEALEKAKSQGATLALPSAELEEALKGEQISLAIDCVGRQSTFDFAQRIVSPGGRVLILGLQDHDLVWHISGALAKETRLVMSYWGTKPELAEVLDLIKDGKLTPAVEEKPMGDLPESVKALEEGKVLGRLAFVPGA